MKLFRYMSLGKFEKLIETKSLFFVKPREAWSEQEEGIVLEIWEKLSGEEREQVLTGFSPLDKRSLLAGLKEADNLYCLCWCKIDDDVNMWEKYGKNGVRIAVDYNQFEKLNQQIELKNAKVTIDICPVKYIVTHNVEIDQILNGLIGEHGQFAFMDLLRIKKDDYSFEQEYRSFLRFQSGKENEMAVKIKTDLSEFIENVKVYHEAPEDFCEKVQELCKVHGIKFETENSRQLL